MRMPLSSVLSPLLRRRERKQKNNTFIDSDSMCWQLGWLNYYGKKSFIFRKTWGRHTTNNQQPTTNPLRPHRRCRAVEKRLGIAAQNLLT